MSMLAAVVALAVEGRRRTMSPTARSDAVAATRSFVKVVPASIVYVVEVPARSCKVTDVLVTAVTTPPSWTPTSGPWWRGEATPALAWAVAVVCVEAPAIPTPVARAPITTTAERLPRLSAFCLVVRYMGGTNLSSLELFRDKDILARHHEKAL